MEYTLREYQQRAVSSTLDHFRRSRAPAVIVLPTGAGKSIVIAELARKARGRVLVLAHVKELVEQNYEKFKSFADDAGIYSAGLEKKDSTQKVIFGGIQSVARASKEFFSDFSLLVVDECHRISLEQGSQYSQVIREIYKNNPELCVLGFTATPYRLDTGWIYRYHYQGELRSANTLFFQKCIFEVSLEEMIKGGYLVPPVQIDTPVVSYDFSSLEIDTLTRRYDTKEIDNLLKDQSRITPAIIKNIIELSNGRRGVMIFTSTVRHAKEVLKILPNKISDIILGDTASETRDEIISKFKSEEIKYLVNVSVLTTGFDAPHVDLIAILRPTESVSLYQQIVGRGLRLNKGKSDCLVLDYTGVAHDIFEPEINDKKPLKEAIAVQVPCPDCSHINNFWGVVDDVTGEILEHFGAECRGATQDPKDGTIVPCGFRYRYQICDYCGVENSLANSHCAECKKVLKDDATKLKDARASKDSHVLRTDSVMYQKRSDANGNEYLEIRYYDHDGQYLSERYYFHTPEAKKIFYYNFQRLHARLPNKLDSIQSADKVLQLQQSFRKPIYVIARKQEKFWRIREKIFLNRDS